MSANARRGGGQGAGAGLLLAAVGGLGGGSLLVWLAGALAGVLARPAAVDALPGRRAVAAGGRRRRARVPGRAGRPRRRRARDPAAGRGETRCGRRGALEFPLVTRAQHAGDGDVLGNPWPASAPLEGEPPASAELDDVILQRGSTRLMDPAATVSREAFDFSLAASLRGTRVPHFVTVHAVAGLKPGLYRWPDLDRPLRREPLREELLRVCWNPRS